MELSARQKRRRKRSLASPEKRVEPKPKPKPVIKEKPKIPEKPKAKPKPKEEKKLIKQKEEKIDFSKIDHLGTYVAEPKDKSK